MRRRYLDCFGVASELGPSAVARELGIAKSTASRTLAVLASRGVLERHEPGRYRLGLRMFEFGQLALSRLNLFEVSVPVLAGLRDRVRDLVRDLVQLGVPMGAEVLCLDRFEAQNLDPRFHGQQWRRVPGHSSSSGRAIAAFNPSVARSAPILIGDGDAVRAIAAVSVAGPTARLHRGAIGAIAARAREAADSISRELRNA